MLQQFIISIKGDDSITIEFNELADIFHKNVK